MPFKITFNVDVVCDVCGVEAHDTQLEKTDDFASELKKLGWKFINCYSHGIYYICPECHKKYEFINDLYERLRGDANAQ